MVAKISTMGVVDQMTDPNYNRTFIYSNSAEIAVTPWDINIKFFRMRTPDSPALAAATTALGMVLPEKAEECLVAMSPAHAKKFLESLQLGIEQFEKMHGTIQMPNLEAQALVAKATAKKN